MRPFHPFNPRLQLLLFFNSRLQLLSHFIKCHITLKLPLRLNLLLLQLLPNINLWRFLTIQRFLRWSISSSLMRKHSQKMFMLSSLPFHIIPKLKQLRLRYIWEWSIKFIFIISCSFFSYLLYHCFGCDYCF